MKEDFWENPTRVYKLDRNLRRDSPVVKKTLTPVKNPPPVSKSTPVKNPYRDMKIPFGKYKGELLADIPDSYLDWLLEQEFFELKFKEHWKMTKQEKEYRKKFNIHIR